MGYSGPPAAPPPTSPNQTAEELPHNPPTLWLAGGCLSSQERPPGLPGGSIFSLKPVSVTKGTISPSFMCQKLLAI